MTSVRQRFERLVAPGTGLIDGTLDRGALLIAAAFQPDLDVEAELARLDVLAEQSSSSSVAELVSFLFGERGFDGDRDDYYNPENSWLNRVLDRRRGIPITLAILTIEIGRRCGVTIDGVGMPGHFLVRCDGTILDPFGGGAVLDERACADLASAATGQPVDLPPGALDSTAPADILRRVLLNLRVIGERRQATGLFRTSLELLASFPEAEPRDLLLLAHAEAISGQFDRAAAAAARAAPMLSPDRQEAVTSQIQAWLARLN